MKYNNAKLLKIKKKLAEKNLIFISVHSCHINVRQHTVININQPFKNHCYKFNVRPTKKVLLKTIAKKFKLNYMIKRIIAAMSAIKIATLFLKDTGKNNEL